MPNPWSKAPSGSPRKRTARVGSYSALLAGSARSASSYLDQELREDTATAIDVSTYAGIMDELFDPSTGERWLPMFTGSADRGGGEATYLLATEQGLAIVRMLCRYLACENNYAINVLENFISYVIGTGMNLTFVPRNKRKTDPEDPDVQQEIDDLHDVLADELDRVNFDGIQEETIRRAHRDGEVFIRVFRTFDGVEFRFVEPRDVVSDNSNGKAPFGIETAPNDVTNVVAYWIASERVPAAEMYHLKMNVDANVRRGIPTLWPIRKNLHRAEKLLKCLSMQAQFQGSIGAIREHEQGDAGTIRRFADERANYTATDPATGDSRRFRRINAGTVVDTPSKVKWTFPSVGVGIDKLLLAYAADLRAAASRVVMPEYMITSDASNGTYASLIAADGPTYRMFVRQQKKFSRFFADVADDVVEAKVASGELSSETLKNYRLVAVAPEIATRDPLADAQTKEIKVRNKVLSVKTWQKQDGLDPEVENRQIDEHSAKNADDLEPVDPLDPKAKKAANQKGKPKPKGD